MAEEIDGKDIEWGGGLPVLFDESGAEYQVGWYRLANGTKKPVYKKTWTGLNIEVIKYSTWSDIVTVQDIETAINATFYWVNGIGRFTEITPSEYGVIKDNTLSAWGFLETRTLVAVTVQYTKTTDVAE